MSSMLCVTERDAEKYSTLLQKSQSSAEVIANEIDQKVLTVGKYRVRYNVTLLSNIIEYHAPFLQ